MTTIENAATAWGSSRKLISVGAAVCLAVGLAGCETGTGLFGGNNTAIQPQATLATPAGQAAPQAQMAKVAIAPIIGAPDNIARQLQSQLTANMQASQISVAQQPTDKALYTLRGYIVSARERTRTKVSYIWDVTDQSGQRVNRITGEEVVVGPQQRDPWASVSPQVIGKIASRTSTSLAAWLPSQQAIASAGAAATQAAGTFNAAAAAGTAARNTGPAVAGAIQRQATQTAAAATAATTPRGPTTGSISRPVTALVPTVVGAPGDGSVALTSAIQRELARQGVQTSRAPGASTYRVEGRVVVGRGQNGKQPITIDWNVSDPAGKKLGTVSQKNEIPQGSLDGKWGQAADAAAAAAVKGIVKLLPSQTSVN